MRGGQSRARDFQRQEDVHAGITAGCAVAYTVTSQWSGGFGGDVKVTNLGSTAINGWTLTWSFTAGQSVTQAWNATVAQSGGAVTATNMSYNASIATGATTSFGFNGAWTGANAVPSSFALNGTTCTGGVITTGSPSPETSYQSLTPLTSASTTREYCTMSDIR